VFLNNRLKKKFMLMNQNQTMNFLLHIIEVPAMFQIWPLPALYSMMKKQINMK